MRELSAERKEAPLSGTTAYLWRRLGDMHVYGLEAGEVPFNLAPAPSELPRTLARRLDELGADLAAFQEALQDLYRQAERDGALAFVLEYLDRGKGETLLTHGRLKRLRREFPVIIRPDIFVTEEGLKVTELDSVPGGFGMLAGLQDVYTDIGFPPLGCGSGIVTGFLRAMADLAKTDAPTVAIAVSDEASDYRAEMEALARLAEPHGGQLAVVHPREIGFSEEGLFLPDGRHIDILYRFFELFDIKNVPKWEQFLYAAKRKTVIMTPPGKAYLEEKLQAALLHHDALDGFFREALGQERTRRLKDLFPRTWVVDGRDAPPQSHISGLKIAGRHVRSFRELRDIPQSERQRWVLKPSGFSPLAWGSHGVRLGADLPLEAWNGAVDQALDAWQAGESPWILQAYHKPVLLQGEVLVGETPEPFEGRGRYCPYYFRTNDGIQLGGVLVTLCPKDKKIIHGMSDAIMAPGTVAADK